MCNNMGRLEKDVREQCTDGSFFVYLSEQCTDVSFCISAMYTVLLAINTVSAVVIDS